ncbi:MAG: NAD(P)H-hydrate dehydratase [Rhodothermia bacterium]|nr:NAD(P)H-hydrate dehydratase [Rhodothermia bacterium]
MKTILTAAQMRMADGEAISSGIPSLTLMENAGVAATDSIVDFMGSPKPVNVCCICGKGNNAGDALVVARLLHEMGAAIAVRMVLGTNNLSADTTTNFERLRQVEQASERLSIREGYGGTFSDYDLIVDGLLGTGLAEPLRDPLDGLVDRVNASCKTVVALDIPTGIHSDTGEVLGGAVRADLTVTMAACKQGLLVGEGPDFAGKVTVVDIGIPDSVLDQAAASEPGPLYSAERDDIRRLLPTRPRRAHKYSSGLALVVAGSPGLTGAPVLASTAAARVGAGAVVCAAPDPIIGSLEARLTEIMTTALPTGPDGIRVEASVEALADRIAKAGALLIGPGLGRHDKTGEFVWRLLKSCRLPVVVDADGLFHLAAHTSSLASLSQGRWILTPHLGELRRLAGDKVDVSNPVETARRYSAEWNCILVLKGAPTVVATPKGTAYIASTGNQALATAGSGDVLAGMTTGFLARGLPPLESALCALFVGGTAVESLAVRMYRDGVMAMDIVNELPNTLLQLSG